MFDSGCADSGDANDFVTTIETGGYGNGGARYFQKIREESGTCLVRFTLRRRSSDLDFEDIANNAGDSFSPGFWTNFNRKADAISGLLNSDPQRLAPLTKYRGPHAYAGRSLFNRDFEVMRHPHREQIHSQCGKIACGDSVA